MAEKKKPKPNPPTNGAGDTNALIQDLLAVVKEQSERLDNFEDYLREEGRGDGKHKVILANAFYKSDEKGILEVTRISKLSPRPLSLSLALSDYLKKDIQSGKTTLPRRRIDYFLRLQLSAGGYNRSMSMPVLQEQVSAEAREDELTASDLEAGDK